MKYINSLLLVFFFRSESCIASITANDFFAMEESVRQNTGKIEELEQIISVLRSEIKILREELQQVKVEVDQARQQQQQRQQQKEEGKKRYADALAKNPKNLMSSCERMIEDGKHSSAREHLVLFLKKNPKNIYIGMATFLIGESYYKEKMYKEAASEYLTSYTKSKEGKKAPAALYKLALCLFKLSENDKAKKSLEKLISDYPNHPREIADAKKLLKKIDSGKKEKIHTCVSKHLKKKNLKQHGNNIK